MKKLRFVLIFMALLFVSVGYYSSYSYADNEAEVKLEESIESQLESLDLSKIQSIWDKIDVSIIKNIGIREYISDIINGKKVFNLEDVLSIALDTGRVSLTMLLPDVCLILGICILCSLVGEFLNGSVNESISRLINTIGTMAILIIVLKDLSIVIKETYTTINDITNAYNTIFPIMLSVTSVTNPTSITSLSVITKVVSVVTTNINSNVVMPIFTICCILAVVGNLNSNIKMGRARKGVKSIATYIMGVTFFVLSILLSMQGVMSNTIGNAFINTAKSSIAGGVPIVGNYILSGFDIVVTSAKVIRNAIGMTGVFIILFLLVGSVVKVMLITIILKLLSGLTEIINNNNLPSVFEDFASNMSLITATLCGSGFVMFVNFICLTGVVV